MAQTPPEFTRPVKNAVYDVGTLSWVPMTQPAAAGVTADVNITNALVAVSTKTALTALSPATASVTNVSSEAVAANTSRKGLIVANVGDVDVSLAFGATAVADKGVTLLPGASFCMGEYDFTTASVKAITASGTSTLSIQEFE